jgi:flagellar hook-length control protein FliK
MSATPVHHAAMTEPPALSAQLGVRLGALRTAPLGEHVLTMRVEPDSIGPVRVVAHIASDGVRIELLGANDQARHALRAALPDLRRDLAATGMSAELDLGDLPRGGADQGNHAGTSRAEPLLASPRPLAASSPAVRTGRATSGLDLEI